VGCLYRKQLFLVHYFFIVSISQREINACCTVSRYQLLSLATFILLASLWGEQQKLKMELETKFLKTISLIDTLNEELNCTEHSQSVSIPRKSLDI
jgi:hypothetical protein